jgi:hypothetical protein
MHYSIVISFEPVVTCNSCYFISLLQTHGYAILLFHLHVVTTACLAVLP